MFLIAKENLKRAKALVSKSKAEVKSAEEEYMCQVKLQRTQGKVNQPLI